MEITRPVYERVELAVAPFTTYLRRLPWDVVYNDSDGEGERFSLKNSCVTVQDQAAMRSRQANGQFMGEPMIMTTEELTVMEQTNAFYIDDGRPILAYGGN